MDRQRAAELLPIIKAFSEGKSVQFRQRGSREEKWYSIENPTFIESVEWRIKPEPTWRPWKPEEVPQRFMASLKYVKSTEPLRTYVFAPSPCGTTVLNLSPSVEHSRILVAGALFESWLRVYEDGHTSPCGVLENVEE